MKIKFTVLVILALMPLLSVCQWTIQSTGFTDSLRGIEHIWAVNERVVWAVANDGSGKDSIIQEFTKTVNGGISWSPGKINNASGLSSSMIFALDTSTAWVTMYDPKNDGGKIFKTTNGGLSWTYQSTAVFSSALGAYPNTIYFWNANEGFCMGDPTNNCFEIYTTSNGGSLWTRVDSANMPAIISGEYGYAGYLSVVGNTVWFGTSKGRIFKSNNKGHNWTLINTPFSTTGKIRFLQFKDTLNGIIGNRINNTFTMYTTINGGSTWQAVTPAGTVYGTNVVLVEGTPNTLVSIGNATGYAGSSISHNYGLNWNTISGSSGMAFTALSNFKNQTGWAGLKNQSSTVGGIARYVIISNDAGIANLVEPVNVCAGIHQVKVNIKNYGDGILDSVRINWKINNTVMPTLYLQTHLAAGQSVPVILGLYNFLAGTTYNFKAYTFYPNGLTDTIATNDTNSTMVIVNPLPVIYLGNDTVLTANKSLILNAGNGFNSYLWSTGDTTKTIVIDTSVTGVLINSTIWVMVTDSNGCSGYDTIRVMFIPNGVSDYNFDNEISIYPNPSNDKFYLNITGGIKLKGIYVYDINGSKIYSKEIDLAGNAVIDLSDKPSGIYFVRIVSDKEVFVSKLLLTRN